MGERRTSYRGSFLEVVTEDVELPNGTRVELDLVVHPGASAVVPFVSDDEVLLIRQYRFAAGGHLYEVPAGKLDPGEAPEACAARELEEEAGRRAGRLVRLGALWPSPGFTDERIHLFAAFDLEVVEQRLEPDEVIEIVPTALDRALEMVWNGELSDAKSALALIHAARYLGRLQATGGTPRRRSI
ncbi:MAG: NUDIX hydrolase [Proteobacteria bacterium]|nr:NUDIX hydrolase [Pseudomonadota bacterium]MCZ6783992.1 NUDIX hydrolase [Pseudomonadota bacterium]